MEPESELPPEVAAAVERLDELVRKFEEHPDPAIQDRVFELLHCVDTVHRAGLRRLNDLLKVAGLQHRAVDDPEVRLLFELYDLGEGGDEERAQAMVDSLRPSLDAVGARLEVLAASAEALRVRLSVPVQGCGDLRGSVEQVLREGLPGVQQIEIEAPEAPPGDFIPLARLLGNRQTWQAVAPLDDVPLDGVRAVDVSGSRLLLVRLGRDEVYAYRNACPGTTFPLEAGQASDGTLRCPWHGCRFDLRGGHRLDADAPGLGVVPVRIEGGLVRVRLSDATV
jgi:nitrite reductase/ring-hydroxylating ferredoxin subunit